MQAGQRRLLVLFTSLLLGVGALLLLPAPVPEDESGFRQAFPALVADDIVGLRIHKVGRLSPPLELSRGSDGWRIEAPVQGPADPWKVSELLSSLEGLQLKAIPGEVDLRVLGLDQDSAARVEIELVEGSGHSLLLGQESPVDEGSYVLLGGESQVARAGLSALLATPDELRDRDPWAGDPLAASAVEIGWEGALWELKRVEEGWTHSSSPEILAEEKVKTWLRELSALRVIAFSGEAALETHCQRGHLLLQLPEGEPLRLDLGQPGPLDGVQACLPGLSELVELDGTVVELLLRLATPEQG